MKRNIESKKLMNRSCKRSQLGSAMTEFAVLAIVLVPVFSMVPLIAKVSDVNQSTIQASRYAAWERTLNDTSAKDDSRLAVEVNNLFFSNPDELIRSGEGMLTGEEHQNSFWNGYGVVDDKQTRLVNDNSSENKSYVVTVNESLPGTISGALSQGVNKVIGTMSSFTPGAKWDLEENGLYVAKIGTNIKSNRFLPGTESCEENKSEEVFACIRRHNAILVDAWESSGSAQVKERVKALVPTGVFAPVASVTKIISIAPFLKEFKSLDEDAFGYVAPDVLPPDRYGK